MHASTRLRRTLAVTASAGLVAVLAMLPSGSAFAVVNGSFKVVGSATSSPTSGNTCTVISGSSSASSSAKTVVGGKLTSSVNLNATFRSSTDTNDVTTVTGHYAGSVNVKKDHGDLASLSMAGTGTVSVQRAEGSASHCRTTAVVAAETQPLTFTESHSGWLVAQRGGTAKTQLVELEVENTVSPADGAIIDVYEGGASTADDRAFVQPGTYGAVGVVGTTSGVVALRTANQTAVTMSFFRAGSAPSGTSGSGRAFVRFPSSVSCSNNSATLTWSSKAGKVASGAFFVNGVKKASVSNPHAGAHVTLHGLSSKTDNKVTVNLSLKGGGHATATRAYLPCKG
jgi:hypothetical protein